MFYWNVNESFVTDPTGLISVGYPDFDIVSRQGSIVRR